MTDINIPSSPSLTENNDPTVPSTSNIPEPEPLIFNEPDIAPDPVNGNAALIPGTNDAVAAVPCSVDPAARNTSPDEDTVNIGIPDMSLTDINTPSNPSATSNNCPTDPCTSNMVDPELITLNDDDAFD